MGVPYDKIWPLPLDAQQVVLSVPRGYYSTDVFPQYPNTEAGLVAFMSTFRELKRYEINAFDCSQMSAYLEWALEDAGFDAWIAIGSAPFDQTVYHAWVLVDTTDGWEAVEATDPALQPEMLHGIVEPGDRGQADYFQGWDQVFYDIYACLVVSSVDEFGWWTALPLPSQ